MMIPAVAGGFKTRFFSHGGRPGTGSFPTGLKRDLHLRALATWGRRTKLSMARSRHADRPGLLDRPELGASELGVNKEPERVGLLVSLHEPVQRCQAQFGQCGAGWVAQQAGGDD